MSEKIFKEMLENETRRRIELLKKLILRYRYDGLFTDVDEIEGLLDFIDEFNNLEMVK